MSGRGGASHRRSFSETLESRTLFQLTAIESFSGSAVSIYGPVQQQSIPASNLLKSSSVASQPITQASLNLAIHNQSKTFATLLDTNVTMTGRSELHITGTSSPLTASIINLNSADAWFFMDNIKPSVVNSTYLSQVLVSGSPAVHGTNVRVVQYGMGTVIIPHAPSYQPMQAFTGPNFTGTSQSYNQYTYYNTAASLGQLNRNISSFKLKRGYMATIATQANGSGNSKVYIAQDHDLDVSLLSSEFDNAVQFVRVFPWRWVAKKGASDISPTTLNASWNYNWNNDQSSSLDVEYVPIRQQRWWPGYPTNKPDSTHLLGFNEPDNPVEDAYETLGNGSVDTAIAVWPELLASGLRVGSPAVTDGGKAWLYEFMDKAIAANLRVDFIAIHNYQAGNSATSLYNWLKDVYDRYHLPIWLTEFNNGANWTGGADPTLEQNATWFTSITDMLDNTPWIERYSVYSAVEAVRQMTDGSGNLTPAGTFYYNNSSPVGYVQSPVPASDTGNRDIAQLPLDGNTQDTSGNGNNGQAVGAPSFVAGQHGQAIQLDGASSYVRLTESIGQSTSISFAAWIYWDGGANWQRIFDFGTGTNAYAFLTPSNGSNLRFAIKNGGSEQIVETAALAVGQWTHVAVTLGSNSAKLYVNGALAATNNAVTIKTSDFSPTQNYLGKSQFAADPLFAGRLDDVLITDYVLTATQIAALMNNTSPVFTSSTITRGPAVRGAAFNATISGQASDSDAGDSITYGKAHGPAWLTVAADGTLSGTPSFTDTGPQEFVVTATDSRGNSAYAILNVTLGETYWRGDVNNSWNTNSAGNTNWSGDSAGTTDTGSIPGASTDVVFATSNASNLPSTTLGANMSVQSIRVATASGLTVGGSQNLTVGAGGFLIDSGAGATTISTSGQVILGTNQNWNNNSTNNFTVTSVISGPAGLTFGGTGTVRLAGNNTYTGSTTLNSGTLRVGIGSTTGSLAGNLINNGSVIFERSNESTMAGVISGSGSVTKQGDSRLNLTGFNTYSGGTTIGSNTGPGIIRASATGAIGTGDVLIGPSGNGTTARLELSGNITLANAISLPQRTNTSVAIQNISGNNNLIGTISLNSGGNSAIIQSDSGLLTLGALTSAATTTRIISLTGFGSGVVGGVISNGSGTISITKSGTGTWTVGGANTYTGITTVSSGTFAISASERLTNAGELSLSGGTFSTNGFSETLGALSLSANSSINFAAGTSTLSFSGLGATFTAGTTINIVNWTQGSDHLFVGTSAVLTAAQIAQFNFNGTAAQQLSTGEIVPVSSAAPTIATGAIANTNPVTGTSTNLSVLGADDGTEAKLTYTWSTTSKPAGAADAKFSINTTNAAKNTVVTFTKAGAYTISVSILDGTGQTVTSSVNITVNSTLTGIAATSNSLAAGSSITASGVDQFGSVMSLGGAATWSSNVGSITQSGVFTAPVAGATSATITAKVGASTYNTNVSIIAGRGWYKADLSGATLIDSSGAGNNGTLTGAYSYVAGKAGNALSLTGGTGNLPAGIVTGLNDFTIGSWVYLTSNPSWARIFDFGTGTSSYMFLTNNPGGTAQLRFAITTNGNAGEQLITAPAISLNTWVHVAVSLQGNVGTLYVNGTAVGTNPNMTLRPANLGQTNNNYLGDSQFTSDAALQGRLDDFRILNAGLNANGIVSLRDAWQAPTVASGAVAVASPVTASAASLSVLGASAAGEAGLTYTWSLTGTPPAPVSFSSNGTNGAKNTTAIFTQSGMYQFLVTITNSLGQSITSAVAYTINAIGNIAGKVFEDRNSNGSIDAGEPTLSGVIVYLDANNNSIFDTGETSTNTNGSGDYAFNDLTIGDYIVRQVVPVGYLAINSPGAVTVTSGTTQSGQNFGVFPTVFTGTNSDDAYELRASGANYDLWLNGVLTHSISQSLVSSLSFSGGSGTDSLLVVGAGTSDPISI